MSLKNRMVRTLSRATTRRKLSRRPSRRPLRLESFEPRYLMAAEPLELYAVDASGDSRGDLQTAIVSSTQENTARGDAPPPVLLVISNQDFWYQDYADTRASLEKSGLQVIVAAATTETAKPHARSGQGSDGGFVQPDLALSDVNADDYSAIVFTGGWGMSQYQYGFEGTYHNSAMNGSDAVAETTKELIQEFVRQDKQVAAICHGVSVLAYARVDGEGLLEGRTSTGWNVAAPTADGQTQPIIFIGGYGAASYQYAFEGTYDAALAQLYNEAR